ncbi:MAG TPA: hypothetical protein VEH00_07535 [Steroidobacteraceae bacterium]|nr:hypothetical protein [Steroidobacteraceae bacterium]
MSKRVTPLQQLRPRAPRLVRLSLSAACACLMVAAAGDDFETVPDRAPAELLPAAMVSGTDFHVADPVRGDGLMNHFVLQSRFGSFDAYGRAALAVRIQEVAALSELSKTSDLEIAAGGAVEGVKSEVKTATGVVTHPVQIVSGIPKGIAHLFGGYKARGQEAAAEAKKDVESSGSGSGSSSAASTAQKGEQAARSYAERYLGITAAERDYYRKLGVDPYTDNKVLRDTIRRDARIAAGAGFGMKFVGLPGIPAIGIAERAVDAIYNEDPAAIRARTRSTLAGFGLSADEIESFMNAPLLSPTRQLLLLAAAQALDGVAQRGELFRHAIGLTSDEEVQVYLRSAGLLAKAQASHPVASIVPGVRLPAALRADGNIVVCGAFEAVYWTADVARLHEQLRAALPPTPAGATRELWVAGTLSERARRAARDLGWDVHEVPDGA